MGSELLVLVVLPVILALAAGWDLTSYTIPNVFQIVLIASFLVFVVVSHMPLAAVGGHLAAGLVGLVAGIVLFALGYIGGGDAKLFACVVLWFGFHDFAGYALVVSLLGGALTLGLLGLRSLVLPARLTGHAWLVRLHDRRAGIPYGVALAAGALVVLPQTEIFRLAAGA